MTFLKWMLDGRTRILMLGQQSLWQMTILPCYWKEVWEEPTVKGWSTQQIFLGLFERSLVTRAGETLPVLYFAQPRMQGHHFIKSHGVWEPGRSLTRFTMADAGSTSKMEQKTETAAPPDFLGRDHSLRHHLGQKTQACFLSISTSLQFLLTCRASILNSL